MARQDIATRRRAAGARRFAAAFATALALAFAGFGTPARAADSALARAIGYSADGQYFAFEEFGIQDGSGFAYSNVYVIDLRHDVWVLGTPVREQASDEATSLLEIRGRAEDKIAPQLSGLGITVPAHLLAANGDGALGTDGLKLDFALPGVTAGALDAPQSLALKVFTAPAGAPCQDWFSDDAKGYELTLSAGGKTRTLHRDEMLPRSRGCPISYRISAVYAPFQAHDLASAVVLLSVYAHGFEGADRRFIAVPLTRQAAD